MKNRFTTVDILAIIKEIKQHYVGHRAVQIYDIDNKTFLIKLSRSGEDGKTVLLIESGIRIHITEFQWPKNPSPSGFSMKLRKHIKNRRLESITQLGSDRIIDLQFGANECAYHLIVELYDRGNMVLTDHEHTILHLVRPRVDNASELKFLAKEQYPVANAKIVNYKTSQEECIKSLENNLNNCKPSDNLRKICSPIFAYGTNLLEHCLLNLGLSMNMKVSHCMKDSDQAALRAKLYEVFVNAQEFVDTFEFLDTKGYIFGKEETTIETIENEENKQMIYEEFHPFEFNQMKSKSRKDLPLFNKAVDEYFSVAESQKSEQQIQQKEKAAMKKLENIKQDHERRLKELREAQEGDIIKGEFIQLNSDLVNRAIIILNNAIANRTSWETINEMVAEGKSANDPVASLIIKLNFEQNEITMRLTDPFFEESEGDEEECDDVDEVDKTTAKLRQASMDVEINLSRNAFENARRFFTMKKMAKTKEDKTISASEKALKSAEVKTNQMLKEVQTVARINKVRKTNWFEKFNWCLSSENYLIVGGKDQQQNELLVKRYFRPGDLYVHADIHGASTVVIKNHESGSEVPTKTLTEAGHMAVVYSGAWDSKLSVAAWWVRHDQVSKTAPTGEYLTTGSFMIRGRKNYLHNTLLTYGFAILFKVSDDCVEKHRNERRVRKAEGEEYEEAIDEVTDDLEEMNCDEAGDDNSDSDKILESEFPDTKVTINLSKTVETVIKEEQEAPDSGEVDKRPHKYVTAKDRRLNRKKIPSTSGVSEATIEEREELEEDDKLSGEKREEEVEDNDADGSVASAALKIVSEADNTDNNVPLKRGQRSKLKKMKKKYKDQDEDDREIKMAIMQGKNPYAEGEGLKHLTKKQIKKQEEDERKRIQEEKLVRKQEQLAKQKEKARQRQQQQQQRLIAGEEGGVNEYDDEEEDEDIQGRQAVQDQARLAIDSLTGQPLADDELLYALPVLAPYSTLHNYKFKVKMIPGTTKRGKAGKMVLFSFLNEKTANAPEKELIKALKDQDITRNFPGRVKVFTQNVKKNGKK